MQCTPCSVVKCIPMECSGFHAALLNAEDSMHCGAMNPDCMEWSPCSEAQFILIDWSGFFAAWPKTSRLNAVDSTMSCGVGRRRGLDLALLWLWCRLAAAAPIGPLA